MDYDNVDDEFYNEIIHRRVITRRTNWRLQSTLLSQRDIAVPTTIHSSLSFYITLMYLVFFQLNQLYNIILRNNARQSILFGRLLHALKYYQWLFCFCCYKVDQLLEYEDNLCYLCHHQLTHSIAAPPRH
jgi:hypothetical protein